MRNWAVALSSLMFAACASGPMTSRTEALFNDQLFLASTERISADDVFALSAEMQQLLNGEFAGQLRRKDSREALIEAIYGKGPLTLEYDSAMTRTAAQAFAARSGNCLSLVIMTAAFAKALGLPVQFQRVYVDETVSRTDDIYFFIGHVNLTLDVKEPAVASRRSTPDLMTIDFLPPKDMRGLRVRAIEEQTIVAMYMNNRAAEAFAQGKVDDAYWWARAAVRHDTNFLSAYNTLGVIYRRHGNPLEAEKVLAYVLERDPDNTHALSNLSGVLNDLGRVADAKKLTLKLEALEPNPPFRHVEPGLQALRDGNYQVARDLFAKEIGRAPFDHEMHYWLARAYVGLGDMERARQQLALALEFSTTRFDHDIYAAKLNRISSSHLQ